MGALDWPELVRLVERVRGAGRGVEVSAMAAGDTSASRSSQTRIPGGWNAVGNC